MHGLRAGMCPKVSLHALAGACVTCSCQLSHGSLGAAAPDILRPAVLFRSSQLVSAAELIPLGLKVGRLCCAFPLQAVLDHWLTQAVLDLRTMKRACAKLEKQLLREEDPEVDGRRHRLRRRFDAMLKEHEGVPCQPCPRCSVAVSAKYHLSSHTPVPVFHGARLTRCCSSAHLQLQHWRPGECCARSGPASAQDRAHGAGQRAAHHGSAGDPAHLHRPAPPEDPGPRCRRRPAAGHDQAVPDYHRSRAWCGATASHAVPSLPAASLSWPNTTKPPLCPSGWLRPVHWHLPDCGVRTQSQSAIARAMRLFCHANHYPIIIHCIHGKDRCAALPPASPAARKA